MICPACKTESELPVTSGVVVCTVCVSPFLLSAGQPQPLTIDHVRRMSDVDCVRLNHALCDALEPAIVAMGRRYILQALPASASAAERDERIDSVFCAFALTVGLEHGLGLRYQVEYAKALAIAEQQPEVVQYALILRWGKWYAAQLGHPLASSADRIEPLIAVQRARTAAASSPPALVAPAHAPRRRADRTRPRRKLH